MGCDIHAIVERLDTFSDGTPFGWLNAGDPGIGRNYEMFAALAGVRSYDYTPVICEPKGMPGEGGRYRDVPCEEFLAYYQNWRDDAHSATWLTLAELKAYDTMQEVDDPRLVTGRDADGVVTSIARATTAAHYGVVGRRRIFTWPGEDSGPTAWDRLIAYMENVRTFHNLTDEQVRLVAFFDN